MLRLLLRVALALFLAGGTAAAQDTSAPVPAKVLPVSVRLNEVLNDLPAGEVYATMGYGVFCGNTVSQVWRGGREPSPNFPFYQQIFKTEMEAAGYKVVTPGQDNLFDPGSGTSDYEIAGVLTGMHATGCTYRDTSEGEISMTIDWQIYARLTRQVVAHVKTSDAERQDEKVVDGAHKLIGLCFRNNLHRLLDDPDVQAALRVRPKIADGLQLPGRQSKIALVGSLKLGKRRIADATGSVVTILTGSGSGTGFLVSTDGYVLTDAHVVGDDKNVRIRWPDGLEGAGTVERIAKNRDVALVKTDARGRTPLAINRGPLTPGDRVYAIGSPMGKNFEGTVSSGVISADRIKDGLRYVQSDVTVSHGSSGGPLLDEHGAVVGLTDLIFPGEGPTGEMGPAGLNLFTPIGDAMDFLGLEQK